MESINSINPTTRPYLNSVEQILIPYMTTELDNELALTPSSWNNIKKFSWLYWRAVRKFDSKFSEELSRIQIVSKYKSTELTESSKFMLAYATLDQLNLFLKLDKRAKLTSSTNFQDNFAYLCRLGMSHEKLIKYCETGFVSNSVLLAHNLVDSTLTRRVGCGCSPLDFHFVSYNTRYPDYIKQCRESTLTAELSKRLDEDSVRLMLYVQVVLCEILYIRKGDNLTLEEINSVSQYANLILPYLTQLSSRRERNNHLIHPQLDLDVSQINSFLIPLLLDFDETLIYLSLDLPLDDVYYTLAEICNTNKHKLKHYFVRKQALFALNMETLVKSKLN